jgi:hypothetical protein
VIPEKSEEVPVENPPREAVEVKSNTSTNEPVRLQSTLTPILNNPTPNDVVASNTTEVPTAMETNMTAEQEGGLHKQSVEEQQPIKGEAKKKEEELDPALKIKAGMSFEEVVKLIGEPDSLVSQNADTKMKLYRWSREDKVLYGQFIDGTLKRYSRIKSKQEEGSTLPLTRELYDQLKEGMELDEVVAILQRPGTEVSSDDKGGVLYLWTDKGGSSFSARFENNKLVRKSGFYVRPVPIQQKQGEEVPIAEEGVENPEENAGNETGENVPIEEERNISTTETEEKNQIAVEEQVPTKQEPSRVNPSTVGQEQTQVPSQNRRIIYAGSPRKYSEEEEKPQVVKQTTSSRRAKLPGYTYNLRDGSYEITIYNPLDTSVKLGLRSGKRGKDITIPAGGVRTVKVPRGDYQFYYIKDNEPTEVQQGGSVQIDGLFVGDVEITLLK